MFLDRDGTLIVHKPYLHSPDEVELLPTVIEALGLARAAGCRLYLFTNQAGVGRGWFTLDDVAAVNARMIELIGCGEDVFAGMCVATEARSEPGGYRKPSPRFILETCAREGWATGDVAMIGDMPSDWQTGLNAGSRVVAVPAALGSAADERLRVDAGVPLFNTLLDAVAVLLDGTRSLG